MQKTKFLALLAAVMITAAANAQFHVGIKGGANITKLTGKSFKEEFTFGYQLGGFAEIPISKKVSIQPEVLFNQYNQDTSSQFSQIYKNLVSSNRSNIKLNYLSIPLLLSIKPSSIISFQVGPQFGVLLDQNKNLLQNGQDAFKKGDFSMLGGVQLKFAALRIYGRYALGLSNLNDIDNQDKWKSQGFQVGVGLAIL